MPDEFWKERVRDASQGKPPFDPTFAPPGYRAVPNDPNKRLESPCVDCDFKHFRLVGGINCARPFEWRKFGCCGFNRPDGHVAHFIKEAP